MSIRPYEILRELEGKPEKEQRKILTAVAPDHEFWFGCYHGLRQFHSFVTSLVVLDPEQFGQGVPPGVFAKIIYGMESGKLGDAVVDALTAFSHACLKDEWELWYKPILEKKLIPPFTTSLFNELCPEELQVTTFAAPELTPVRHDSTIPKLFYLEPHFPDKKRVYLFLKNRTMHMYLPDGTPVPAKGISKYLKYFAKRDGIVFEGYYVEGEDFIVRDVFLWDQMFGEPTGTAEERNEVMQKMYQFMQEKEYPGMDVIERYECSLDEPKDTRESLALLFQQGYTSVVIRGKGLEFLDENSNVLVEPTKKSVLTCIDITEGEADTQYAGRAEYICGSGAIGRKKFESSVFHGLTFDERGTCFKQRDKLKGRKFEVLSCGLAPDGKLLFPIFQHWRKTK